jgi:hypothetical protein
MLDFSPVFRKETTLAELTAGLELSDLAALANEVIDTIQDLIADCVDQDVTFVPVDPNAHDTYPASEEETDLAWTLGHVIVHTTAGSEEAAFIAAELARGVEFHGRSRSEVPWESVTTIEQCRQRLEESRRMRLGTLQVWPNEPHLDNTMTLDFLEGAINRPIYRRHGSRAKPPRTDCRNRAPS